MLRLIIGELKHVKHVKRNGYKYVVLSEFIYESDGVRITVPPGFLTDGSTYSPDTGYAWIFHDYLYATHKFDNREECSREQADNIMVHILNNERRSTYSSIFHCLSKMNIFWIFSRAWDSSGKRGPENYKVIIQL